VTVVLVDANVLIDVALRDPPWFEWSRETLRRTADESMLVINPIVYAEVAAGFDTPEEVDEVLPAEDFARESLPWPACFLAGRCFVRYRRHGGNKRSPLPDFFIGAHAAVAGYRLLTRDARRYRRYFPTVNLIAPD